MARQTGSGLWNATTKICIAFIMLCMLYPSIVSAQLPYRTVYVDPQTNRHIPIQPLYIASRIIDGNHMEIPLSNPGDLFIAADNHVFIADTGNDRIVELDEAGRYIRSIGLEDGAGKLNQPEGVFVADDGTIYVANTGDETIVKYKRNGELMEVFAKPDSNLLGGDYYFLPSKIVVDQRGVMYIVVKDSHKGLLRMNPEGEFTGFFGANKAKLSLLDRLKRSVLNKEQLAKEVAKRPNSIQNVTLTREGFLITTSSGTANDGQIKKLNAGGVDAFQNKAFREWHLVDTAIDDNGFLYGLNQDDGRITVYDPTGKEMFYFSGGDKVANQLGITNFAASIAVNGKNELWVVDNGSSKIHIFERTSFGDTFLTAAHLYFEGDYAGSKPYWEEVIRENGMLNISFDGLGKIALHEQDYRKAMHYFQESSNAEGYSDAFWNIRYEWIQQYFLISIIVLAAVLWLTAFLSRKVKAWVRNQSWPPKIRQYGEELKDAFYLIIHPYEGFYRLKDRNISLVVIAIILLSAVAVRLLTLFGSGFIAYPYDLGTVNIRLTLGLMVLPWITWVIANYLVSTVKGGEGRFREVLQASTFAVVPYIVMSIPAILISNIFVLEERILLDLIHNITWIWVILLFLVMTQVIHNFDFVEAIKNACITLFTIGVIWIFVIIMFGLGVNFVDFLKQIYREVTFHG